MPSNPLLSIWTHRRATIRELKETGASGDVLIFAALSGIASTLDNASSKNFCDTHPLSLLLIVTAVIGPIGGLITVWLGSMLIQFSGGILKGRARTPEIRLALAWGLIPRTASLFPWIAVIAVSGPMFFSSNQDAFEDESLGSLIPLLVALLAIVVCNVWSIFTTSHALAEVQGFKSAWKGLLNVVLAFLVVLIPFILLAITVLVAGKL